MPAGSALSGARDPDMGNNIKGVELSNAYLERNEFHGALQSQMPHFPDDSPTLYRTKLEYMVNTPCPGPFNLS